MKYQIVHEDDKHFKVHNPKDGSHFVVAKKGLSKEFIEKAQKLCGGGPVKKYSEGGEVEPEIPQGLSMNAPVVGPQDVTAVPENVPPNAGASSFQPEVPMPQMQNVDFDQLMKPVISGDGMAPMSQPSANSSRSEMPIQAQGSQSPVGAQDDYLGKAASAEKNALMGIAGARQSENKNNEKTLADQVEQQKAAFANLQKAHAEVEQENAPLRQSILEGKVDPNRYWNNKTTAGKVSASIGLILGGIGQGLMRSNSNAALDVMEKNIERDVQSQRDDLGKKQTLYSMNLEKYKNADSAYAATMLNSANIAKTMIEQAAAKSGSQQAMLQAQAAGAQIDMKIAPLQQQLAIQKMSMAAADPIGRQIRALVPDKQQGAVYSEVEKAQNAIRIKDDLMKEFNKADKDNTIANRAMHLGYSPQSIANMRAMVVPLLKDSAGRVTEPELERVDGYLPAPGDTPAKIAEKRKGLADFIDAKSAAPRASSYGIRVEGGRFDNQGASKIKEGKPIL